MWKSYDVTNGLGHTYCNDILTARRVLACIQKSLEIEHNDVVISLHGDSFDYALPGWDTTMTYSIESIDVWNRVPDFLKKYDDAE